VKWSVALVSACVVAAACGGESKGNPESEGRQIANARGCLSCHTTDGSKSTAPTWKSLYGSRVELDDGMIVSADEAYLRESMLQPSAKTVKGFEKGLMETVIRPNSLQPKEVRALLDYIKSLR
jgi:cytochrome c oxidase subunit II